MKTLSLYATLLFGAGNLLGQSGAYWSASDGGNGHFYQVTTDPQIISWSDAEQQAASEGGYLATITSQSENAFLTGLVTTPSWIGGFQSPDSLEPAGGWNWISGEPFDYTNWAPGEPNNEPHPPFATGENKLQFYPGTGTWNDLPNSVSGFSEMYSYVVEYGAPSPTAAAPEPSIRLLIGIGLIVLTILLQQDRKSTVRTVSL